MDEPSHHLVACGDEFRVAVGVQEIRIAGRLVEVAILLYSSVVQHDVAHASTADDRVAAGQCVFSGIGAVLFQIDTTALIHAVD